MLRFVVQQVFTFISSTYQICTSRATYLVLGGSFFEVIEPSVYFVNEIGLPEHLLIFSIYEML